jgi:hypothetical protein
VGLWGLSKSHRKAVGTNPQARTLRLYAGNGPCAEGPSGPEVPAHPNGSRTSYGQVKVMGTIAVLQLNVPLFWRYWVVNQNLLSSAGSTTMLE